mmetsp:Transcript_17574/g.35005  ORF Transcript_17574/g.35005 Transcript_17574/m.35005 type:complete len:117 (+) Transcript_17574:62-412(+)
MIPSKFGPAATVKQHSGLQREVFALYRSILRAAMKKDSELAPPSDGPVRRSQFWAQTADSSSSPTASYAKECFRTEAFSYRRIDFTRIEFAIRQGKKKLALLEMKGVKVVGGSKPS